VAPVFEAIGSRTVWAGDELGQATALKLACNAWVASINAAVAQSLALAEGFGLDPNLFLQAIQGGPTDTTYAHVKGAQMLAGSFDVSFALDGVLKDLGLIESAGSQAGVDTSWLHGLRESYVRASEAGHGAEDMAAVVTSFRP
jgi:3-hydroxyisobutyrate dehydrogenase